MIQIKAFAFNAFQENTYILSDEEKQCIIIDPGCFASFEMRQLENYIDENSLNPLACLLTHAHIDHILGCQFIAHRYGLLPRMHFGELPTYQSGAMVADMYGIKGFESVDPSEEYLREGETLQYGQIALRVLFTPGHSPASVSFYQQEQGFVIAGDVLFRESIGRTDLPGGDFATLEKSIKEQLYTLPLDTKVYCGHGPTTTIRYERVNNPFVRP
jgi:hydroxyacylglutathione hydrolase